MPKFEIQMTRLLMNTILQEKSKAKGFFKDTDLREDQYVDIQEFLQKLHEFELILNFESKNLEKLRLII
jgi:flagellin-specific chaperone FliS